ncbi:Uncharacterised protein [Mycobacteroides abscessus subsp. abscessus]|nr:Uncharacterised protein [Mycobacteroides abscessus subsp. abscessus]
MGIDTAREGFVDDEILWAAFMPDVAMRPQMRINRRINGAFQVQPLRLQHENTNC